MSLRKKLKEIREHGLFHGEKLVADGPVQIAPVPEYPVWAEQPAHHEPSKFMKPITIENPRHVDIAACFLIALAFVVISLL